MRKSLTLAAAIAALTASPAAAAGDEQILNEQIQWGDVFAKMDVVVPGAAAGDIASGAVAQSNAFSSAQRPGAHTLDSEQDSMGATRAVSAITAGEVAGDVVNTAHSGGNSVLIDTQDGDTEGWLSQDVGLGVVRAKADTRIGEAASLNTAAVASANNVEMLAREGDVEIDLRQANESRVVARAQIDADDNVAGDTAAAAVAVGNTFATSSTWGAFAGEIEQTNAHEQIRATTNLIGASGAGVAASSNAAGNSISVDNRMGLALFEGDQENDADVKSNTNVDLSGLTTTIGVGAYGVGNSALVNNLAGDLHVLAGQSNTANVAVSGTISGSTAVDGVATLGVDAVGNAFTGFACAGCTQSTASGEVYQRNKGSITSVGTTTAASAGAVTSVATAFGNTASFTNIGAAD